MYIRFAVGISLLFAGLNAQAVTQDFTLKNRWQQPVDRIFVRAQELCNIAECRRWEALSVSTLYPGNRLSVPFNGREACRWELKLTRSLTTGVREDVFPNIDLCARTRISLDDEGGVPIATIRQGRDRDSSYIVRSSTGSMLGQYPDYQGRDNVYAGRGDEERRYGRDERESHRERHQRSDEENSNNWGGPNRYGAQRGQLRVASGLCLDVSPNDLRNGGAVQLWACNGTPNQTWTYDRQGRFRHEATGKCLDVAGGYNWQSNGRFVQLWDCNDAPNQRWSMGRGGLRNAGGLCLDAASESFREQGGRVQTWACHGRENQAWFFDSRGR